MAWIGKNCDDESRIQLASRVKDAGYTVNENAAMSDLVKLHHRTKRGLLCNEKCDETELRALATAQ